MQNKTELKSLCLCGFAKSVESAIVICQRFEDLPDFLAWQRQGYRVLDVALAGDGMGKSPKQNWFGKKSLWRPVKATVLLSLP